MQNRAPFSPPASPTPSLEDDESSYQVELEQIQQLEDLQKLLEKAHKNEENLLIRAQKAEEKLDKMTREFSDIQQILADKESYLQIEKAEKNEAIEKLTSERDISVDVARSLQKSNLFLQAAYDSLTEQTKELQKKHEQELDAIYKKHDEDFNNSTKRHKTAIKKQHDLITEKDMEIAVLRQALDFNGIPLYSTSKAILFKEQTKKEPYSPAESKKNKRV